MLLLILAGIIGSQPDKSPQQVEFLRLSYKANKDSFAFGAFRFEFTRGSSASFSDAESELFTKKFEESGYYAFDGDNARYDLIADQEALAAATKRVDERKSLASIRAFRSLTDGKFTLRDIFQLDKAHAAISHSAIMFPGTDLFYRSDSFEFPLNLGDKGGGAQDLFQALTGIRDGKITLDELDMDSRLGGLKICKFTFSWKDGKCTYWIDVDRGSVPLRILDHYNPNNLDVTYIFSDLERVPNAGWLPRRRLHIIGKGAIVDRIVVTHIDAEKRPPPSTFQLDFPEPIALFDNARKVLYPQRKSWNLHDLPSATAAGVRPTIRIGQPAEMPGEVVAISPWSKALVAVVLLLLVIGSVLILRRRVGRTQGV